MNPLFRSISISLLSLISMGTVFARSGFEVEQGTAQYAGDPSGYGVAPHTAKPAYRSGSWEGPDAVSPVTYEDWIASGTARPEDGRLSLEQRRALRNEINEAGRELYRQK